MSTFRPTRRRFGVAVASGLALSLAGCTDEGPGDEDDDELDDAEPTDDDEDADEEDADDETQDDAEEDDGEEDDGEADEDGGAELTIILENEDGEPVSQGVFVTVDHVDDVMEYGWAHPDPAFEDGEIVEPLEDGEYTITVESEDDEFETIEDEFTIDGEDKELAYELEGATPDSEQEDDDEDEEDE